MSRFTILLAGRVDPTPALLHAVAGTRVVAADRGIRHAAALGVTPELWVGDFDSASSQDAAAHAGVPREDFPRDKDWTDGELAIEAAIARGATSLLLVGALGGPRSDHAFSHLVLALRYAAAGLAVKAFDGCERAVPIGPSPQRFDAPAGTQFSILKFSALEGLTIRGAKWPLVDVAVPFHSILTQSNEVALDPDAPNASVGTVEITLLHGTAIALFQSRLDCG